LAHIYFNTLFIPYFTFFVKWKTNNQLNISLVHLLADENAYIVMVLSQKGKIIIMNNEKLSVT